MNRCVLIAVLALCSASTLAQGLRDPFERPAQAPLTRSAVPGSAETDWKPDLRAVMLDRDQSLVNIGGKILAVGESVNGYTLVTVRERSAILIKDGIRITLMLDKERLR
ncbi:hypothetical protein RCH09_002146 [Actimicrobium sp. GrIS 1.19]|uniref:hypothetical protein n=1 Tax=Actimicrobium sp. GrIS 1.19 TaxID=3071708 RepID=UPI002DFFBA7D|nr:hypothetical protein [Actimicrobium sp. GrIS 1.19]